MEDEIGRFGMVKRRFYSSTLRFILYFADLGIHTGVISTHSQLRPLSSLKNRPSDHLTPNRALQTT